MSTITTASAADLAAITRAFDALVPLNRAMGMILAAIIVAETGFVVTPFLPGDSLLFAAGMFAAREALDIRILLPLAMTAAIVGDNTNYWVGRTIGPRLLRSEKSWILNKKHLDRTHEYFEKYGAATVVIARFVPIVRTFAPFVAGVGAMSYPRYVAYSVFGGVLWVGICTLAGYFLGSIPVVAKNFEIAVLTIIGISLLLPTIEWVRRRREPASNADRASH